MGGNTHRRPLSTHGLYLLHRWRRFLSPSDHLPCPLVASTKLPSTPISLWDVYLCPAHLAILHFPMLGLPWLMHLPLNSSRVVYAWTWFGRVKTSLELAPSLPLCIGGVKMDVLLSTWSLWLAHYLLLSPIYYSLFIAPPYCPPKTLILTKGHWSLHHCLS